MASSLAFEQDEAEERFLNQALYVDLEKAGVDDGQVEEDNSSRPPATGEEYLRQVIREAKKYKAVTTADNAKDLLALPPERPTHVDRQKAEVNRKLLASTEWQRGQVQDFSAVRTQVARHSALDPAAVGTKTKQPKKDNEAAWCCYTLGTNFWNQVVEARKALDSSDTEDATDEAKKTVSGNLPLVHLLVKIRPNVAERVLEYFVDWAELLGGIVEEEQGLWLYAIFTRLEKPLHPDVGSTLRTLALVCSKQRQRLAGDNTVELERMLPHLNLIICLVAKYFDQADLADAPEKEEQC